MEFDMTTQRDLKQIIRARMEKTGESFSVARRHILANAVPSATPAVNSLNEAAPLAKTWHHLIETTEEEAKNLLAIALECEPRLTHFGIGLYGDAKRRRQAARGGVPANFMDDEFAKERLALFESLEEVAACADWVKRQDKIKTFNTSKTSYGYKHTVERWFDHRGGPHLYISNGSFIAAAVGLGFAARLSDLTSPNVYFQFSKRTIKAMSS